MLSRPPPSRVAFAVLDETPLQRSRRDLLKVHNYLAAHPAARISLASGSANKPAKIDINRDTLTPSPLSSNPRGSSEGSGNRKRKGEDGCRRRAVQGPGNERPLPHRSTACQPTSDCRVRSQARSPKVHNPTIKPSQLTLFSKLLLCIIQNMSGVRFRPYCSWMLSYFMALFLIQSFLQ